MLAPLMLGPLLLHNTLAAAAIVALPVLKKMERLWRADIKDV